MPRLARLVVPGMPHHVTQRGNYRRDVFLNDANRRLYLELLREHSAKHGVSFLAFCLMSNHVHFVVVPATETGLAKTFHSVHTRYSRYFNSRIEERGHLWQARFHSCVLEESHLLAAVRYVERNPVRAGLVGKACDWPWSSASFHAGLQRTTPLPLQDMAAYLDVGQSQWLDYLSGEDDGDGRRIRVHTLTGRPLGAGAFIARLEERFGRELGPSRRGRPRKSEQ